jgi:hypothetical protein
LGGASRSHNNEAYFIRRQLVPATTTTTKEEGALEEDGTASGADAENFGGGENFRLGSRQRGNLWGDGNFTRPEIFQRGLAWLATE